MFKHAGLIALAIAAMLTQANAAITITSPRLSPSLGEYESATVVDENSNIIPALGVVVLGSSSQSGLATVDLVPGVVSPVTNRRGLPQYKLTGGKRLPVMGLVGIDTSGKNPVPFTLPGSSLSGTVAIANGGTGQTSANAALNALLPSQTSNAGKTLTTDGTNTSWTTQTTTIDCNASVGGATTEALTCTGVLSTDQIRAVTQKVTGTNNTAITSFGTPGTNTITIGWTANPGSGAIVRLYLKH